MFFNPATASTAGAAFAALLAVILFAVLGNLAITGDRDQNESKPDRSPYKYAKSLGLGLPILALLLSTTYMFVLVSGLVAEPVQRSSLAAFQADVLLRGSAFEFIICGSALAVSAAGVILIVGLVVAESGTRSDFVRDAVHRTLAWGIVADAIFLTYGYHDIASAFGWHPLIWTLAGSLALGIPIILSIVQPHWPWLHRKVIKRNIPKKLRLHWHGAFFVGFTGLVIVPVVFFRLWFNHKFYGGLYKDAIGPLLFTVGCALWAGISLAAFIWISKDKVDCAPSLWETIRYMVKAYHERLGTVDRLDDQR